MSGSGKSASAAAQRVIEFDNNRLLPELYGEHGKHLARIEQTLDVSLANRGNQVFVSGDEEGCDRAARVLTTLYDHLERGAEVTGGDVDGALRMSLGPVDETPVGNGKMGGAGSGKTNGRKRSGKKGAGQPALRTHRREVLPRSPTQAAYINALLNHELVVGTGPAGTGKTYLAVAAAAAMLVDGQVDRIILSRPAVEAGESLGFLPGDMRDKVDPYLRPLYDALYDMMPAEKVDRMLASGEIEIAPLAFMRGRTLTNGFVIIDEAQNTTPVQMKMVLTRLGEGSRMVITGDMSQVDLPTNQTSGLADATARLRDVKGIGIMRLSGADVVRHPVVARILKAYDTDQ